MFGRLFWFATGVCLTISALFFGLSFSDQPETSTLENAKQAAHDEDYPRITGVITDVSRYTDLGGYTSYTVSVNNVVFPITEYDYPFFKEGETVTVYKGLFFGQR